MSRGICTIVSKNYLAHARTLINSYLKFHPDDKVFVLLVDKVDNYFEKENENFTLIELEELDNIPNIKSFLFKYNILELNTAAKPFFLEYIYEKFNVEKLIYFDPDIMIMNKVDPIYNKLDNNSVVLTPHITSSIEMDGCSPSETDLLKAGTYNLGFIGLGRYENVKGILKWWQERLYDYCVVDIENGLFVDQKWMDLLPTLKEDTYILRNPEYNIAYWNLHERQITYRDKKYYSNENEIVFFHFSGFDINLQRISKHQNRFELKKETDLFKLFSLYKDKLETNGYFEVKGWPYFYSQFNNGVKIPNLCRQTYYNMWVNNNRQFINPFEVQGQKTYYKWLQDKIKGTNITNLLYEVYKSRVDLQIAFRDIWGEDQYRFINWAMCSLKNEYEVDDVFIQEYIELKDFIGSKLNNANDENMYTYLEKCDGRHFIEEAYRKILGREADLKGLNHYLNLLEKGYPKKLIIILIARSREAKEKDIRINYKELLWSKKRKDNEMAMKVNRIEQAIESLNISMEELRKNVSIKQPDDVIEYNNLPFGVNLAGYLDTESGVGEAARAVVRNMHAANTKTALNNIEQEWLRRNDKSFTEFTNENPYFFNIINVNADQVPNIANDLGEDYFKGRYNIGYWFWELSEFPEEWKQSIEYFDEIWTASDFCVDAIGKISDKPVVKMPIGVNLEYNEKYNREHFGIKESSFVFLFMFDFMSFFKRKNPLAVIKAFKEAFAGYNEDDVVLVLKYSNSDKDIENREKILELVKDIPVKIIDKYLDKDELHGLIKIADSYVSLHRSEGLGLTLLESMKLGKPVIGTAYSGNMEFMNVNNSYLAKYDLIEIEEGLWPYKKGNVWADVNTNHVAQLMREIYENQEESKKIGEAASHYVENNYNEKVLGERMNKRLQTIYNQINRI